MKKNRIIQQSIAGFLLCLFFLAMTPEKILHDFFADHKDETLHCSQAALHLHKAVPNCHCDKVVVQTPFIGSNIIKLIGTGIETSPVFTSYFFTQPKDVPQQFRLRGPPAFSANC